MIPLWQGTANTWDCDEMGHMNVRVYVEKALEGLGAFAAAISMPNAFRANAPSTLIPADQHIRFIHEVYAGVPLSMHGCVLDWDETSVLLYQEMRHPDGRPAAAFRTRLIHVEAKTGRAFPWSHKSRSALAHLIDTPPEETRPRGIDPTIEPIPDDQATLAMVADCAAPMVGLGTVPPQHCDLNGRMLASWFMGRISDSVPNLLYQWRNEVGAGAEAGGAVVEYRLVYRQWPRAGDRFVLHSSLGEVNDKTHTLVHWLLDPDTGQAWATTEAIALTFDLKTRKVLPTSPAHIKQLEKIAPRGLKL